MFDGTSPLARLMKAMETGQEFGDVLTAGPTFVTQILRCNRIGFVKERDFETPVFTQEHGNLEQAKLAHQSILRRFADGRLDLEK